MPVSALAQEMVRATTATILNSQAENTDTTTLLDGPVAVYTTSTLVVGIPASRLKDPTVLAVVVKAIDSLKILRAGAPALATR